MNLKFTLSILEAVHFRSRPAYFAPCRHFLRSDLKPSHAALYFIFFRRRNKNKLKSLRQLNLRPWKNDGLSECVME